MRGQALRSRRRPGFTLVELLIVIALLMTVVTLLANLFMSADDMVAGGSGRARAAGDASVAFQSIAADLREAVADSMLALCVTNGGISASTYGVSAGEIWAVTLHGGGTGTGRAARAVGYYVRAMPRQPHLFELVRVASDVPAADTASVANVYWNGGSPRAALAAAAAVPIAQNVASFRVGVADETGLLSTAYASGTQGLPQYLDIYLELLDERDAVKVADLQGRGRPAAELAPRVDEWARRYTTRIHFENRYGYRQR